MIVACIKIYTIIHKIYIYFHEPKIVKNHWETLNNIYIKHNDYDKLQKWEKITNKKRIQSKLDNVDLIILHTKNIVIITNCIKILIKNYNIIIIMMMKIKEQQG